MESCQDEGKVSRVDVGGKLNVGSHHHIHPTYLMAWLYIDNAGYGYACLQSVEKQNSR